MKTAKEIATKFFYWWYNQPSANTEQGFDSWAKTDEGKQLLASQPKWISVEERLPDPFDWVIGCNDEDEKSFQTRHEEHGWSRSRKVTHWQPLPTPPTK